MGLRLLLVTARPSLGSQVRKKAFSHCYRGDINPVMHFYSRQVFPNTTGINIFRKGSGHCPGKVESDGPIRASSGPEKPSKESGGLFLLCGQGPLCYQSPGWGMVPQSGKGTWIVDQGWWTSVTMADITNQLQHGWYQNSQAGALGSHHPSAQHLLWYLFVSPVVCLAVGK